MWHSVIRIFITLALVITFIWLMIARPFVFNFDYVKASIQADPKHLQLHTEKLSNEFIPRDWKHVDNLNKAADYIFKQFQLNNSNVSFQKYTVNGISYSNVVSEYGSTGEPGTVVIGAHYDSCDEFPGADDNASGVAGLLELGRLISGHNFPFKIILVGFTLEEPPFFGTEYMGSAVHAASLVALKEKVQLMISLEMIGYYSDLPNSQSYPVPLLKAFYPSKGNFLAVVGPMSFSPATLKMKAAFAKSVSLPLISINAPAILPGIDYSDHRNYWKHGFDAVMITDTAFFRNDAYHTERDTSDRLDYYKMAQAVTGVYYYLLDLAQ